MTTTMPAAMIADLTAVGLLAPVILMVLRLGLRPARTTPPAGAA